MPIEPSKRLQQLPPYLFAEMERKKSALVEAGRDIIDLGIGDPDQPPPKRVLDALTASLDVPRIHTYSSTSGTGPYREAVAAFMKRRYGLSLETGQICLAVGSKELIAHTPLALTDPGDVVLIPEPGYPPYLSGTVFAHCEPVFMPLRADRGFLPDFSAIPEEKAKKARILFLNYPNNPTGAVATREFYEEVVAFAKANDVLVVSDDAYGELYFDDAEAPISFLETPGAMDVGVEVHSMSKTCNMTGWRLAWVTGQQEAVDALRSFKANCDSGQFMAMQKAAAEVLNDGADDLRAIREMYRGRRDALVGGLRKIGWEISEPKATFYLWFPVPGGGSSMDFADRALEKANVVVTPGIGFGPSGEGFARIALTVSEERLAEAADRLAGV